MGGGSVKNRENGPLHKVTLTLSGMISVNNRAFAVQLSFCSECNSLFTAPGLYRSPVVFSHCVCSSGKTPSACGHKVIDLQKHR